MGANELEKNELENTHSPKVTFAELTSLLNPLGALNSSSELHGLLCGKLAGGATLTEVNWLLEAVEFLDFTSAPDERVRHALSCLYHQTHAQLQGDLNLQLMLPDDDNLLSERTRALSEWCHGFLSGFGSVDRQNKAISEEAQDMLQDLAAIVQVESDDEENEPSAEANYMEVTEYLRQVASALYFEFTESVAKALATDKIIKAPISHQIH
jgi:uncharacterized protein